MKFLLALSLSALFSGCASEMSPEDRDFFYRGWRHPEQASRERMYGRSYANGMLDDDAARHTIPSADSAN